jgi:hypothetical protein
MAEGQRLGLREIVRRLGYHPATPATIPLFEANRARAIDLALYWDETLPPSREASLAQTHLQNALMYANGAVALHTPLEHPLPENMPPT